MAKGKSRKSGKGENVIRKRSVSLILWFIGILGSLIIGAYFSPILSGFMPFLDTFPPYVYSTYPPDNIMLPYVEEIRIHPKDIGGSGLDTRNSKLQLFGKRSGNVSCSLLVEAEDLIFKPEKNLTADEYTAEIFVYDRAGNVGQKTLSFEIAEPNISVKMEPYPVFKNGDYYARFYIVNEGRSSLSSISAEYQFLCFMNETIMAVPESRYLEENSRTQFDIPFSGPLKYNCSLLNFSIDFYEDERGNIYSKCANLTPKGCGCCYVNISVSAREIKEIKRFRFCYPFTETEFSINLYSDECLSENQINEMNLTEVPERRIGILILGFQEPCLRGEIELDWCKEQGVI